MNDADLWGLIFIIVGTVLIAEIMTYFNKQVSKPPPCKLHKWSLTKSKDGVDEFLACDICHMAAK